MTLTIKASFEARQHIRAVEGVFSDISDPELKVQFREIFAKYHRHFTKPPHSRLLVHWVNHAIDTLKAQIEGVSVSLPSSEAITELHQLYALANDYVVLTHVGSNLELDLEGNLYEAAMTDARKRRIPVICFYLYDPPFVSKTSIMTGSDETGALTKYEESVEEIHDSMAALMSVVIVLVEGGGPVRQLLLADGELVVEAPFFEGTRDLTGVVRATGAVRDVADAKTHFQKLMRTAKSSGHVFELENSEVNTRFPGYVRRAGVKLDADVPSNESSESYAMAVLEYVLSAETGSVP